MSIAASPRELIDAHLTTLSEAKERFRKTGPAERAALLEACTDSVREKAAEWVQASCRIKGIAADSPQGAEEWIAGPMIVMRGLRLMARTMRDIQHRGRPRLPGAPRQRADGHLSVPVFPTDTFDRLLYNGIRAEVWMQPEVTLEAFSANVAPQYQGLPPAAGISLVLGAGNVTSIPPLDVLSRLFVDGHVVLLKMHPLIEDLGPILARALGPVVDSGFVRIIYGGAEVGAYAIQHPAVDDIHITGGVDTHDDIVWGTDPAERDRRKARGEPLLDKPVSSELGNVSPVVVAPGPYTERELVTQAENVASMLVNNAGFNCNAAKLLVTWRQWEQRDRFLELLQDTLSRVPGRPAYYPGAEERYRRFVQDAPELWRTDDGDGRLPWTLVTGVAPESDSIFFREEAFCGILAETALDATDAGAFLHRAAGFVNERVWGTLNACLIVHPAFRKDKANEQAVQDALSRLRYGTIGINIWPAAGYALMTTPWGGWQPGRLDDVQSGVGWVHNTFMLERAEKCVVEGPLVPPLKPVWFATHRTAHRLAPRLVDFEHRPAWGKLPRIVLPALKG